MSRTVRGIRTGSKLGGTTKVESLASRPSWDERLFCDMGVPATHVSVREQ
jgi:hypothetical protein